MHLRPHERLQKRLSSVLSTVFLYRYRCINEYILALLAVQDVEELTYRGPIGDAKHQLMLGDDKQPLEGPRVGYRLFESAARSPRGC